ncbi:TonB-dependent hemoglobin/transferrin/lactoferrin family receptor [Roseateles depolymerans]|uniref:TonB-dependent receptor n=1 Tax=Roseateles depolymerans TaxID=76731 RepID=A0A0U3E583_9BURK|nr:TonB-dependent hemoglobin/transferrin/lactoferrin family receptor [Roseateles depolymerans]ALV08437.1 TonB-dependent receptor [Roseateles depolymerans]REG21338.1 hemoglobin/transferrin/lactoferrin receptor protein [Roseateles depolymerans]
MSLRQTPVALALSVALPFAFAQTAPSARSDDSRSPAATPTPASASTPPAQPLGDVTVSATRTERATASVPNTVTVITRKDLDRRDARDLKDLLSDEVDLSVKAMTPRFTAAGASTGRAGNEGINIRGLEGNQVLMMVDGIRVPQSFAFGPFASGRADFVDLDSLSTAEVLRGPASTSYGSDGLAGALVMRTLSPEDLLKDGKTFAGYTKLGLQTVDRSKTASAAVALRSGDWSSLIQASIRRGHETRNQGDNDASNSTRTAPNPTDIDTHNVLAKLAYRVNAAHQLTGTVEVRERKIDTDVLTGVSVPTATPASTAVIGLTANDRMDRRRVSLEHRYEDLNATWIQQATTHVYVQDSKTEQFSAEDRYTAADRTRYTRYEEHLIGLSSQAQTQWNEHRLSYGVDVSRNTIEATRDGTVPPAGETFPSRPFPKTRYQLAGAFLQDEIELGTVSLIPALRFEHYQLTPSTDDYTGTAVKLSDRAVTPRLGAVWRATDWLQPYVQWSQGFRAPTPDQVNNAFANPLYGYSSIGNPDLKPEHANSWELGVRGQWGSTVRWQLSAYDNRYRDFISQQVVSGSLATANLVYQYINLSQARIKGVEARAVWDVAPGLSLQAAVAHAEGHSTVDGVQAPLNTVQPLRATLKARYERDDWSGWASLQHSNRKKASDISSGTTPFYAPGAYDVVDLGGAYRFNKTLSLSAAVTNLFDRKYWRWSDVTGVTANSTVLDSYTAPGRALQLSLRADF